MAEEEGNITSDNVAAGANGEDNMPQVGMLNQYIKDLSVENPNAPQSYSWEGQPQVDVQVNIQVNTINEEVSEIVMTLGVKAAADAGVQFNVELDYATLFGLRNVPEEQSHPSLPMPCVMQASRHWCLSRLISISFICSNAHRPIKWPNSNLLAKHKVLMAERAQ